MKSLYAAVIGNRRVVADLQEALKTASPVEAILIMQYLTDAVALDRNLSYLVQSIGGKS